MPNEVIAPQRFDARVGSGPGPMCYLPPTRWVLIGPISQHLKLAVLITAFAVITIAAYAFLYAVTAQKLVERIHFIKHMRYWTGREQRVLDVGCGSGLFLLEMAKKLPTDRGSSPKAVGVDWWPRDRSLLTRIGRALLSSFTGDDDSGGSSSGAYKTLLNAFAEGVSADRIQLRAADIRTCFDESGDSASHEWRTASFDAITIGYVMNELSTAAERTKLIADCLKLLKPGGTIAVLDIRSEQILSAFAANGIGYNSLVTWTPVAQWLLHVFGNAGVVCFTSPAALIASPRR